MYKNIGFPVNFYGFVKLNRQVKNITSQGTCLLQ